MQLPQQSFYTNTRLSHFTAELEVNLSSAAIGKVNDIEWSLVATSTGKPDCSG